MEKLNRTFSFEVSDNLKDVYLNGSFYVRFNRHYTATVRNLESLLYAINKLDPDMSVFGEIVKSCDENDEFTNELIRMINSFRLHMHPSSVGDYLIVNRNQGDRDAVVLAEIYTPETNSTEQLIEYEMPNGTTSLNVIFSDGESYKSIAYKTAIRSKKWGGLIDVSKLIYRPQKH